MVQPLFLILKGVFFGGGGKVIKVIKVVKVFKDEGGGGIFGWFGEQMDILVCFFYECGLIFLRPTCDIYVSKIY